MKNDETAILLHHMKASDMLWLATRLGIGDEMLDRLRANRAADEAYEDAADLDMPRDADTYRAPAPTDVVPDATPVVPEVVAPNARTARDRDTDPPEALQLTGLYTAGPTTVMLTGPAWCYRDDYETFVEAGGAVDTRGFAFELREPMPAIAGSTRQDPDAESAADAESAES